MTDNIIKFPKKFNGKKMPKVVNINPTSASEDLDFADNLAEGLMIGLIHNIGENGIDIKNERFIGDISFLNEVVRGILYRDIGFKHPIQPFMEAVVNTKNDEVANTVITKVDLNLLEDLLVNKKEDDSS
tara:strand:+ start:79 stop:465 length:387 start_codon:yes stop_codon:yes gene_type:complete